MTQKLFLFNTFYDLITITREFCGVRLRFFIIIIESDLQQPYIHTYSNTRYRVEEMLFK